MASFGEKIVILFVCFLITYIPITSQIFVWLPWLHDHHRNIYLWLIPYNLIILSIWVNYYLVCITSPGHPPPNWEPSETLKELKKSQKKPRFCQICKNHKPPRAHHCSACDKCICKMDHHCPWIGGCVGYKNHGYFIRFLASVTLGTLVTLIFHTLRVYEWSKYPYNPWIHSTEGGHLILLIISNFVLSIFVFVPVAFLNVNHIYYLLNNMTTIEDLEKNRTIIVEYKGEIKEISKPYHIGIIANISAVLGSSWYFWWLPNRILGDGVYFPIRPDALGFDPMAEPISKNKISKKQKINKLQSHVRRGSEGYEIDTAMLRQKLQGEFKSESSVEDDFSVDSEDDLPLSAHMNKNK